MMKKIKLQLTAGQQIILSQMIGSCNNGCVHGSKVLLLEWYILLEWLHRNTRRFIFATDKPLLLARSEAMAMNRVMQACAWPIPGAGGVATEIIGQLEPKVPAKLEG